MTALAQDKHVSQALYSLEDSAPAHTCGQNLCLQITELSQKICSSNECALIMQAESSFCALHITSISRKVDSYRIATE